MSLTLTGTITALAAGLPASFAAQGGTEPYVYSVVPGGAGGTIDADTGLYTAPLLTPTNPKLSSDVVLVTDADENTATKSILVTDALGLFCEILQTELSLSPGRVYLFDQKIMQPTDAGLFIAVSVLTCRAFANTFTPAPAGSGLDAQQSLNMMATLSVDAISRSNEALMRKEEILLALRSFYSQSQQELNSFFIGSLPPGGQFVSLSNPDGGAIPYRFNISVNIQYFVRKIKAVPYFDTFDDVPVVTEP